MWFGKSVFFCSTFFKSKIYLFNFGKMGKKKKKHTIKITINVVGHLSTRVGVRTTYVYELPVNTAISTLMYRVRQQIKLEPAESLFLFLEGKLASMSRTISTYMKPNKKEVSGTLCCENAFG